MARIANLECGAGKIPDPQLETLKDNSLFIERPRKDVVQMTNADAELKRWLSLPELRLWIVSKARKMKRIFAAILK